jgi:uncharacterized membrane-anchored protein
MTRTTTSREPLAAKVPEITLLFWVLKILTTGMGEAMSDFLGQKSVPIGGAIGVFGFAYAMRLQLRRREYRAPVYWFAVMMVAVFGTMIADVLKDGTGVSYAVTTPVFAIVTAVVFYRWQRSEGTLSIHTITTRRRERFYWCAVLSTFALGTAAGDLVAEKADLGYGVSIAIFGGVIALITIAYYAFKLNAVLAFWLAYIMTRPLGASIGDFMSQHSKKYGGLGLGTTGTSYIFLGCILALVIFLSITRRDATEVKNPAAA